MNINERKIEAAHEKHAWTLAFLVFGGLAVVAYFLGEWLEGQRGGWAEIAYFFLYIACFFAIFGLSALKDWFLDRLYKPESNDR